MNDFFDDFDEGEFMDGNDFDDQFEENFDPEDCFEDGPDGSVEPDEADAPVDDFSAKEAFMFGVCMHWAYEEGLEDAERQKLAKKLEGDKDRKKDSDI